MVVHSSILQMTHEKDVLFQRLHAIGWKPEDLHGLLGSSNHDFLRWAGQSPMPPPKKEPKQLVYSAIEMRELLGIGLKSVGVNFRARPGEMLVYNDGWTVEQLLRCKAGNMYISGTVPDELLGEHVEPGFCRLPFFKAGAQGFDRPYMYMEYGGSLHITCPLPVIFAALLAHYRATRQDFLGGNWCYCRETMWCFDHRQRVRIRMNSAGRIEIGSFGLAT